MKQKEFKVLGTLEKKRKLTLLVIAAIAVVALMFGAGFYCIQQPEKIKTGKNTGESTIVPELQTAVDSLLKAQMTRIGNCLQGQTIVMKV